MKTVVTDVQTDLQGIQTDIKKGDSPSQIDQAIQKDISGIVTTAPRGF